MRDVSASMWAIWKSGDFVGEERQPMTRVTIQVPDIYEVNTAVSRWRHVFNQRKIVRELPNLKSCTIDRNLDEDVATATFVFYNTSGAEYEDRNHDMGQPGYYSFARGEGQNRWNYQKNRWFNIIAPDRVIRSYQGYGVDWDEAPEKDPHLVQTGEWHIHQVELDATGQLITVKARDRAGPALVDQIVFPPVIPLKDYPLSFESIHDVPNAPSVKWNRVPAQWDNDSNTPWTGKGKAIYGGHNGVDAFDSKAATYWLSVGNSDPNASYAFEWVQAKVPRTTVDAVNILPWKGNYVVYVSVFADGAWQGTDTIPYDPAGVGAPNGANIKYVKQTTCGYEKPTRIVLPQTYHKVTAVRVTFHNLYDSNLGTYQYRAGLRTFLVEQRKVTQTSHKEGNYSDYSDLVKKFLCWGGFFWPQGAQLELSDDSLATYSWTKRDPVVDGRVWGDIEMSGTSGPAPLGVSVWDKKPLMDAINYVREILGFIFFVDEEGAAVFRSPNLWQVGNYLQTRSSSLKARTNYVPQIDEKQTIRGMSTTISKRNSRHRVFVGNSNGQIGAAVDGREPLPVGWKREAIWTDQHFSTKEECALMAELIAVSQLFTFRESRITISGMPAFQPDDQVKVYERVTADSYYHYVKGINSTWDAEEGTYEMTLTTHWLGAKPHGDKWFVDPQTLSADTKDFLAALGKVVL